ncbi:MAG: aminotransferase class I/II-fold pyridoxal phosphate-dependent enzyme, partial [Pirellulales bacterium]
MSDELNVAHHVLSLRPPRPLRFKMPTPDDVCPRPPALPPQPTRPHAPAIFPASVYECESPQQADELLSGRKAGYVYSRDGHPNADQLAEACRELHGAERAAIAASGMGAMAAAALSQLQAGDHVVVSRHLYGRSLGLLVTELERLGIHSTVVDGCDLQATAAAMHPATKLLVVETITNPCLRVSNIAALAEIAHRDGARLLVDNTLASPAVCRPIEWGADLVLESLTKIMNGHSDVVLGLLCGSASLWERVPAVISTWGLASGPFDCWLALRGLGTLALRVERAAANALRLAEWLKGRPQLAEVYYPGLADHPDHELAQRQLGGRFGAMVTMNLAGGLAAAEAFIAAAKRIAFCPSLGELATTLSHPQSTSHRALTDAERTALGITPGTLR